MKAAHVPTNHSAGGTFRYDKDGNTLIEHEAPTALTAEQLAARAKKTAANKPAKAAPKSDAATAAAAAKSQE